MLIDSSVSVLVTGANGGLGAAIARRLHVSGAKLVLSARRPDAVEALAREVNARVVVADLALREDVERLARETYEVDVLVANAALPASGPALDFSVDEIDRALEVNLRAPVVLARILAEKMVERGRGQIVFISSIAGKVAPATSALYSATKFGVRGFALGLREDLKPTGVGVSTVFPGFIRDAGMFANTGVTLPAGVGTRSPGEVAEAVVTAITRNPDEITVAAIEQRFAAVLGGLAPAALATLQRAFGADQVSEQMSAANKNRR